MFFFLRPQPWSTTWLAHIDLEAKPPHVRCEGGPRVDYAKF